MEAPEVQRGIEAGVSSALELGVQVDDVVVINNSDRIVIRLLPDTVLARIAPDAHEASAHFEVQIAKRLEAVRGPIGELAPRVKPQVYRRRRFAITFWRYYDPHGCPRVSPADYAQALAELHLSLRQIDLATPHFMDRVAGAQREILDEQRTPSLAAVDRTLLLDTLSRVSDWINQATTNEQLLHGEPHPGNLITTFKGPLFVDLGECCRGPIEFDIAHAPDEVAEHYRDANVELVHQCRTLMWALFTTWRWRRDDQLPNREHWRKAGLHEVRNSLERYG